MRHNQRRRKEVRGFIIQSAAALAISAAIIAAAAISKPEDITTTQPQTRGQSIIMLSDKYGIPEKDFPKYLADKAAWEAEHETDANGRPIK